jgi:alpha-mannosidase
MPQQGELSTETVRASFNFNNPLKLISACKESCLSIIPIVLKSDNNLILDTVKLSEDDEDISLDELPKKQERSVIVRVYDALGGRGRGNIETTWSSKVFQTNLLEGDGEEVPSVDGEFEVGLGPFQVCTYRLFLA